ncbi:MAG: hypothetical protein ACMUHX_10680 [bacterium]
MHIEKYFQLHRLINKGGEGSNDVKGTVTSERISGVQMLSACQGGQFLRGFKGFKDEYGCHGDDSLTST